MIWSRNKLLLYRLVNSRSHLVLLWLSCVTVQSRVTTRCVTGKARCQIERRVRGTKNCQLYFTCFCKKKEIFVQIQILLAGSHTFIVTTGRRIFCTFICCVLEFYAFFQE